MKQFRDALAPLGARAESMNDERLLDDLARPHARVQRRVGILKDDLHVAPRGAQPFGGEREHVLAVEPHRPARRFDQPEQAAAGRGLAAARLANQPERLALVDAEAHIVNGRHGRAVAEEARRRA